MQANKTNGECSKDQFDTNPKNGKQRAMIRWKIRCSNEQDVIIVTRHISSHRTLKDGCGKTFAGRSQQLCCQNSLELVMIASGIAMKVSIQCRINQKGFSSCYCNDLLVTSNCLSHNPCDSALCHLNLQPMGPYFSVEIIVSYEFIIR